MTVIGTLALLICLATVAAPFAMREQGWIWWSRFVIAGLALVLASVAAFSFRGEAGMEFIAWLVASYGAGEILQLIFYKVRGPLDPVAIYRQGVDYKIDSPMPIPPGSVETRAPKADPEFLRRLHAMRRDPNYQPGSYRQRRA